MGGDYTEEGANYTVTVPVEPSRFMFTMLDTGGDGVCCNHGTDGSYRVYYDGELVASGGEFGFSTLDMFGTCAGPQTSKPTNMVRVVLFVFLLRPLLFLPGESTHIFPPFLLVVLPLRSPLA